VKIRAPKSSTWLISVILAVLGILLYLGILKIPVLAPYNFWLVAVAFILLALGSILKGL
jgi:endonuclease/exonuclease/phosphatase (EEP) superfamily protein YafD